jgi:hypothetical protein
MSADEPTVASFVITGSAGEKPTLEACTRTLTSTFKLFCAEFQRMPDDHEFDMLWVAVQRYYGVPERLIEPPHMRRQ